MLQQPASDQDSLTDIPDGADHLAELVCAQVLSENTSFPHCPAVWLSGSYGVSALMQLYTWWQDEVILVETSDAEGSSAQIIYRNGGIVDARSLEVLCDKVCQTAFGF